jgi:hypothetical protein
MYMFCAEKTSFAAGLANDWTPVLVSASQNPASLHRSPTIARQTLLCWKMHYSILPSANWRLVADQLVPADFFFGTKVSCKCEFLISVGVTI